MPIFDGFTPFSFAGVKFPYKKYSVRGGLRDHVHEYPHSPGGAPEKLGRKLYEITVTVNFESALADPKYPKLLEDLAVLRIAFESEETSDLNIPHIGVLSAYAINWDESVQNMNRSGVESDIVFREDQESAFLTDSILKVTTGGLATAQQNYDAEVKKALARGMEPSSIFDAINDAANSVLAFKDQFDLYGSLIESKIIGLTSLIREADSQLKSLDDPTNYAVLNAMLDLWQANEQLHRDLLERGIELKTFITPALMPLQVISSAIFGGDASRAADLLKLNALEDPFAIPAGTTIRYYDAA